MMRYSFFDGAYVFPKVDTKCYSKKDEELLKLRRNLTNWVLVCLGVVVLGAVAIYRSYQGIEILSNDTEYESIYDSQENGYNKSRLPIDILPVSYVMYLHPSIALKLYTGFTKIKILCKHSTSQIILHSSEHKVKMMKVLYEGEEVAMQSYYRNDNEMLILKLSQNLTAGVAYELIIEFYNKLTYGLSAGIYLNKFMDGDGKKHDMVTTNFEPTDARKAWPCFDEPSLKATWEIIVQHPKTGFHAISNMPVKKKISVDKENVESSFYVTPKMSSYLVAVVVTEYEHKTVVSPMGVEVNVYAPAGRLNETNFAIKLAPLATDFYAQKFGVKYPLPKLDLVPYPVLDSGAEENWGLIAAAESSLLYDSSTSSVKVLENIGKTIVHEISHQWFGDLVTMKWWDDLWLKESFASYFEDVIMQVYFPSWNPELVFYSTVVDKALVYDSSKFTHPIAVGTVDPKFVENNYDAITYDKGCAVINMLAKMLGNDVLYKGLNIYLNKYNFSNADTSELWEVLSEVAPSNDVVKFMNLWVTQTGFPMVTFKRSGNVLVVKQKRFGYKNLPSSKEGNVDNLLWHIPISVKICGKIIQFTLKTKSRAISIKVGCSNQAYFKANYGSTGYYRVHYHRKNWLYLLKLLNTNNTWLPPVDRANLLADVNSLVRYNHADITLSLDFTLYLREEHEYVPWEIGLRLLTDLRNIFYHTNLKNCFEEYILKQIAPVIDYLDTFTKHTHSQKKLVAIMLGRAVMYNMRPIISRLQNTFLKWMISGGRIALPTYIRKEILKAGVMSEKVNAWNFVLKMYENAKSVGEQVMMLHVLAYTKDKDLLERLVGYAMHGRVVPQRYQVSVLNDVCRNHEGRDIAWKAAKTAWNSIAKRYSSDPNSLQHLLDACLGSGSSAADLTEAKSFKGSVKFGMVKYMDRVIESVELNIKLKRKQKEVTSWFRKKFPECLNRS